MRRIEFIGYALDQAGLRSGIKKRDRNALGLVGRSLDCLREASRDAAPGNKRSIRSCCAGTEALGYDFPLIINVIDSRTVG